MQMDNIGRLLDAVDELVEDEKKIVTYKYLCNHLALKVYEAKKLLDSYTEKKAQEKVNLVYTVIGQTDRGIKVSLIRGNDLEKAKKSFRTILSCHIYSVQKAELANPDSLYTADYDGTRKGLFTCGCYSAVRFDGAKPLSEDELNEARLKLNAQDDTNKETVKACVQKPVSKPNISTMFGKKLEKTDSSNKAPVDGISIKSNDQPKVSSKSYSAKEQGKPSETRKTTPKARGIGAFMKKGNVKTPDEKKSPSPKGKESGPKKTDGVAEETIEDFSDEEMLVDDELMTPLSVKRETTKKEKPPTTKSPKGAQSTKTATSSSKTTSKPKSKQSRKGSEELPAKKRRRIQELSSSSDEDSDQEMSDHDVIPPSPEPNDPKTTSMIKVGPMNARKKRVLKSKTFVDTDGSMLTEKAWESVSCSSEDERPSEKVDAPKTEKPAPVKKSPVKKLPEKKKQSSIMGFFAKKS